MVYVMPSVPFHADRYKFYTMATRAYAVVPGADAAVLLIHGILGDTLIAGRALGRDALAAIGSAYTANTGWATIFLNWAARSTPPGARSPGPEPACCIS